MRKARLAVMALSAALAVSLFAPAPAAAQRRDTAILKNVYFMSFRDLYYGQYDRAMRGFREAGRSAIRTVDTRWIDSICYHTMSGEVHYRMGQLAEALNHYDSALRLYLQYPDWMLRVQFPETIGPDINVPSTPGWGQSTRRFRLGRFPDTYNILRGGQRVVSVNGKAAIANINQLHPLHVAELVRCTSLAIRRRGELLGPMAKYDSLTQEVLNKLSARQGPPNHWSEVWIDLQLGVAYAAAGKKEQAVKSLQRSMLAGGEFDHPLTCVAMLELGRLALEEANHKAAAYWLAEASYSAYFFERPEVIEEALRLGQLVHLITNQKGLYPPLLRAPSWANTKRLKEMYASLLIATAENHAVIGDAKRALQAHSLAQRNAGRGDMAEGAIGARLNYVTALINFLLDKPEPAAEALGAAIKYQRTGSHRLFQIAAADRAYVEGHVRERVALELYEQVLREPTPADWRHDPLESLTVLLVPQPPALEHWFDAAMKRDDALAALNVAERIRRRRFFATLPMGGRLLNLRWILGAPENILPQEALLQRNDLAGRYPEFVQLQKQSDAVRDAVKKQPLLPDDGDALRDQGKQLENMARIAERQEAELRKIAIRREPADLVFPPPPDAPAVQKQLAPGQAILVFHAAAREHHAFLLTAQRYGHWKISSPSAVKEKLAELLRAMGHYDQRREMDSAQLADESWRATARSLLQEILAGSKVDLGIGIDELVIVPDGLYWYVPFAALQVGPEGSSTNLLNKMQLRYAATLGLATPDGRGRRQSGDFAVVQGHLFPREDESLAVEAVRELRQVVPRLHAVTGQLPLPTNALVTFLDGLIVLDDIEPPEKGTYDLAPLQVDKGRPGASIADWMTLPWGGPDLVALPGFHTPAEDALKRLSASPRPGDDVFFTALGLMATGTRTVVLSRWRTGGRTANSLMREFVQELPNTTAQDAWQRGVLVTQESPLDPQLEPRVRADDSGKQVLAVHPFFWSGYLVIDPGDTPQAAVQEPARPELKFPGKP